MTIHGLNDLKRENKYVIIYIVQLIVIQNAINEGWNIKQIGSSTYEFTKLCSDTDDFDLSEFISKIAVF